MKKRYITSALSIIIIILSLLSGCNEKNETSTNTAPVSNADYIVIEKNLAVYKIDALANDIYSNIDNLTISSITTPTNGNNNIKGIYIYYYPSTNFTGVDFFSYTISDGNGGTNSATVYVIVADINPIAIIDTTMGTMVLELYEDKVPNTVENFVKLANDGFYNGTIFHRIKSGFMIQAGMQTADGTIKTSPYGAIDLETNPDVKHVDGAISMARTSDPNSATSQFFICDGVQSFLDGSYAAFGVVIVGIEVVRAIASAPNDGSLEPSPGGGKPLTDIIINGIEIENQ
jgi:peptidyl-prolyl cis-trans isomerase B (cyclophilin B)